MKLWDATSGNLVREFKPFDEKANPKGHTGPGVLRGDHEGREVHRVRVERPADQAVERGGRERRPRVPAPDDQGRAGPVAPGRHLPVALHPGRKVPGECRPGPAEPGYVAVWNVADGKLVAGKEVSFGPVFGLAVSPDGKNLLLGCGPKVRQIPEAEAVLIPLPVK